MRCGRPLCVPAEVMLAKLAWRAGCRTAAWYGRATLPFMARPAVAAAAAASVVATGCGAMATRCEPAGVKEQLTSLLTRLDGIESALASAGTLVIRPGRSEDAGVILGMIHDLAILEKELDQVKMTAATLRRDGWPTTAEKAGGAQPRFECFIAEVDGDVVGFALFFHIYSTWEGLRCARMRPRSDIYVCLIFPSIGHRILLAHSS